MASGKVSMHELTISKQVDKASPKLLGLCTSGKHIKNAVLCCGKSTGGKNPEDFLTIKLDEVYVSSFQAGSSHGEDVATESISLAYSKISYDYKIQDKAGTLTTAGTATYDQKTGQSS